MAHYDKFTSAGKTWINCVKKCLTRKLVPKYKDSPVAQCPAIRTYAFDTHVGCYTTCGFCNIWSSNLKALFGVYDLKDLFSGDAWRQMRDVGLKCIG